MSKTARYADDVTYINSECYKKDLDDICYEPIEVEEDYDEEDTFGYRNPSGGFIN